MGHDIGFGGCIEIVPPLNPHEVEYLDRFAETRHDHRSTGPYSVYRGDASADEIVGGGRAQPELPGHWCRWVPTAAGGGLIWDQEENFHDAEKWLAYLIDTFLKPGATIRAESANPVEGRFYPAAFEHFTCDHVLNGVIEAVGEDEDDLWRIEVRDSVVFVIRMAVPPDPAGIDPRAPNEWTTVERAEFEDRTRRDHVFVVANGETNDLGPAERSGFAPVERS